MTSSGSLTTLFYSIQSLLLVVKTHMTPLSKETTAACMETTELSSYTADGEGSVFKIHT